MNDFEHLPEDLQDIARALAVHRDVPDGHLLERVLARVKAAPRPRRGFAGFFRARLAALSMLVLCLGLNVTGALAAVLQSLGVSSGTANSLNLSNIINSLTQTVSTGSNWQSAADEVYCDEHGKSGSDDNARAARRTTATSRHRRSTANGTTNSGDSEKNGGTEENNGGGGNGQCCPTRHRRWWERHHRPERQPADVDHERDQVRLREERRHRGQQRRRQRPVLPDQQRLGWVERRLGEEHVAGQQRRHQPATTSGSGKSKVTTYTTTTTTTTPMPDMGSGNGNSVRLPDRRRHGRSEQNGGSEKVDTKVDTYTNGAITNDDHRDDVQEHRQRLREQQQSCRLPPPPPRPPQSGGSENNMSPHSDVVKSTPVVTKNSKGQVVSTVYTQTTTTDDAADRLRLDQQQRQLHLPAVRREDGLRAERRLGESRHQGGHLHQRCRHQDDQRDVYKSSDSGSENNTLASASGG